MKDINDIYVMGRTEPTVYHYLIRMEKGEMSKEEALIGMVLTLVEQKREVVEKYMNHMERCATPRP